MLFLDFAKVKNSRERYYPRIGAQLVTLSRHYMPVGMPAAFRSSFDRVIALICIIKNKHIVAIIRYISFYRQDVIMCTHWLAAGVSMGDLMPLILERSSMVMQGSWATLRSSLCCQINSQGFCISFMIFDLRASTFRCIPPEATLMCMERLEMRRYQIMLISVEFFVCVD